MKSIFQSLHIVNFGVLFNFDEIFLPSYDIKSCVNIDTDFVESIVADSFLD